jgi:hypothetical protein
MQPLLGITKDDERRSQRSTSFMTSQKVALMSVIKGMVLFLE